MSEAPREEQPKEQQPPTPLVHSLEYGAGTFLAAGVVLLLAIVIGFSSRELRRV